MKTNILMLLSLTVASIDHGATECSHTSPCTPLRGKQQWLNKRKNY